MKAKTRFIKMFFKLPLSARSELVYNYAVEPINLVVCYHEIINDTKIGKDILNKLGYKDDKRYTYFEKIAINNPKHVYKSLRRMDKAIRDMKKTQERLSNLVI